MKVFRASENDPDGPPRCQKLRKGVADLHRRAEISQQSDERYLAHGLIHKVPKTHRYTVSPKGRETIAALLAARSAKTQQLMQLAA